LVLGIFPGHFLNLAQRASASTIAASAPISASSAPTTVPQPQPQR
jgi:hypothetical protein